MIYTVTISPAIDYVVHVDHMTAGATNRSTREEYYFGGKGINVSLILESLGIKSKALGFVSGFTGVALEEGLKAQGLKTDFVHLHKGITRINVKIKSEKETELNTQGALPEEHDFDALISKLECLDHNDILVLSGSVPKVLPEDTYERIISLVNKQQVKVVLDTAGIQLINSLKERPFLVKPNIDELRDLFGDVTPEEGAKKLQLAGARNVIVSMGGDGAILLDETGSLHRCGVATGKILNTVGAGDSMVAGFITGYLQTENYDYALQLGSAAGSATALSPGLADGETIGRCLREIKGAN